MTDMNRAGCLALALLIGSASAGELSQSDALALRREGKLLPFETILSLVSQHHPEARLLEVELEEDDGFYVYEIEILTSSNTVRELEIDASTGAIIDDELED